MATIGNSTGTMAVGVLVLLGLASDSPPTRPTLPKISAAAPPTEAPAPPTPPSPRERVQPSGEPAPKQNTSGPPSQAPPARSSAPRDQPRSESPPPPETPPRTEGRPPNPTTSAAATLNLSGLEQRLRDTKAIGVFTKLSLKNQVDDLLEEFREFHRSRDPGMLAKRRQAYDLLILKVLSLLQDEDPGLARDIALSREALWNVLTDPDKFKSR